MLETFWRKRYSVCEMAFSPPMPKSRLSLGAWTKIITTKKREIINQKKPSSNKQLS
jgi:hypothetical protein